MCSSDSLSRLVVTICPALEQLHSDMALLTGTSRYSRATSATRENLRDAWAQYLSEGVFWGETHPFRVEDANFTFLIFYSSLWNWFASSPKIDATAPHIVTFH